MNHTMGFGPRQRGIVRVAYHKGTVDWVSEKEPHTAGVGLVVGPPNSSAKKETLGFGLFHSPGHDPD